MAGGGEGLDQLRCGQRVERRWQIYLLVTSLFMYFSLILGACVSIYTYSIHSSIPIGMMGHM